MVCCRMMHLHAFDLFLHLCWERERERERERGSWLFAVIFKCICMRTFDIFSLSVIVRIKLWFPAVDGECKTLCTLSSWGTWMGFISLATLSFYSSLICWYHSIGYLVGHCLSTSSEVRFSAADKWFRAVNAGIDFLCMTGLINFVHHISCRRLKVENFTSESGNLGMVFWLFDAEGMDKWWSDDARGKSWKSPHLFQQLWIFGP